MASRRSPWPRHRRAQRRHPRRLAAGIALALALAALLGGSAQALTPPAGTPNLAEMTLQPSDFKPGAPVLVSSYFPPGAGLHLRAEFNRDFGAVSTTAGVKLAQVQTQVTLADTAAFATTVFNQIQSLYSVAAGRATLVAQIVPVTGKGSNATLKNATFGKLTAIGVGQQSLSENATIHTDGVTLAASFAWVRVDDAIAFLAVLAAKPTLAQSVTITLARTVASRMTSVLKAAAGTR